MTKFVHFFPCRGQHKECPIVIRVIKLVSSFKASCDSLMSLKSISSSLAWSTGPALFCVFPGLMPSYCPQSHFLSSISPTAIVLVYATYAATVPQSYSYIMKDAQSHVLPGAYSGSIILVLWLNQASSCYLYTREITSETVTSLSNTNSFLPTKDHKAWEDGNLFNFKYICESHSLTSPDLYGAPIYPLVIPQGK